MPDTTTSPPRVSEPAPALAPVAVWDLPVRFVHWALVALLVGLIVTGQVGNEWMLWHIRFGQALLALLAFRLIWGFIGSRNARFGAFLYSPAAVVCYLRSIAAGRKEVHVTHNPTGGWMVVALLVALLVQASAGLFTNDDILWGGPLSEKVSKETSDAISAFHRQFWWVVVALSLAHTGAVLAYLALWKDDLIAPMFTGVKQLPEGSARPQDAVASMALAVIVLALCGFGVWYLLNRL